MRNDSNQLGTSCQLLQYFYRLIPGMFIKRTESFVEKQNIQIIEIIIDTLQEMLPADDPRRKLVSKDLITYVADRKGHDRRYAIAPDKIKAEVGWEPETKFEDGIRKTIAWFFEHEDWMKNVTSGDYQKYYEDMYQNR